MYNEMEYQEEYRMADLIRRQWLGIITAEEQAELEAWSLQEEHARLYAKIRNQAELQKRNLYVDGLDVDGVWHKLREQIADVPVRNAVLHLLPGGSLSAVIDRCRDFTGV